MKNNVEIMAAREEVASEREIKFKNSQMTQKRN